MSNVTIVTGIWDIKRDELSQGWSRNFQHYLNNLEKLLKTQDNMIIYIEEQYRNFVEERRENYNTQIIVRELEWFKNNGEMFDKIQKIRKDSNWYSQSGWLVDSTQAKLEMYNPLVMSKMFLLNDASIMDSFNSEYMVWVDGALTNTVHEGYFWKDNVISKFDKYLNKFSFVCFPYDGKVEIHGFKYEEMCKYSDGVVDKVARGGIFGGPKNLIHKINEIYHNLLNETLNNGLMGTEESLFTIMTYKYPEFIQYYEIEENGLLGMFFENLKNETLVARQEKMETVKQNPHNKNNVALYVLTYNSPSQFEKLCLSFEEYDRNFLDKPKKYLINNSLNHNTDSDYNFLCEKYGFEEIKKDNIGICGGRQFISEHAEENGFDYHFFFEDDMGLYGPDDEVFCRNGLRRYVPDLYTKVHRIMAREEFDYLKLSFTEVYMDNNIQVSWYNVPQFVRSSVWPEYDQLPASGLDPFAPRTKFDRIEVQDQLSYVTGEVYYANWPMIVSKKGNRKMFIDTKWGHPYEQTWMSYIFQETMKKNINPAILLAAPVHHNRIVYYKPDERREN